MRKLWQWYRNRRWYVKVPLGALAVLLVLVTGYTLIRALQYQAAARQAMQLYVPRDADFEIYLPKLSENLDRLAANKDVAARYKQFLKDKPARDQVDDMLKSMNLPTFTDFIRGKAPVDEAMLRRVCGRELVAVAKSNDPDPADFFVATRVGFWDYWLLPAVDLFGGMAGLQKQSRHAQTFFKRGNLVIGFAGNIVLVSSNETWVVEALRRKGSARLDPGVLARFRLNLEARSRAIVNFKSLKVWSLFGLPPMARAKSARGSIDLNDQGVVLVDLELDGIPHQRELSLREPDRLLRYAPSTCHTVIMAAERPDPVWNWYKRTAQEGPDDDPTIRDMRVLVKAMEEINGEERILPLLNEGYVMILASHQARTKTYRSGHPLASSRGPFSFISGCAILPTANATAVYQTINEVCLKLFAQKMDSRTHQGIEIRFFKPDLSDYYNELLQPCFAMLRDVVLLGNDVDLMCNVINVISGTSYETLHGAKQFRDVANRLGKSGIKNLFRSNQTNCGLFFLGSLKEGIRGNFFLQAIQSKPPMEPAQYRAMFEQQILQQGRQATEEELNMMVEQRQLQDIEAAFDRMVRPLFVLDYAAWMAYEITPGSPYKIKLAFGLK